MPSTNSCKIKKVDQSTTQLYRAFCDCVFQHLCYVCTHYKWENTYSYVRFKAWICSIRILWIPLWTGNPRIVHNLRYLRIVQAMLWWPLLIISFSGQGKAPALLIRCCALVDLQYISVHGELQLGLKNRSYTLAAESKSYT